MRFRLTIISFCFSVFIYTMLTPNFELDQTDEHLIIKIKARFANVNETEVDVNGNVVIFYSSPYYLRLHLPGEVAETDSSSGSYDWDSYVFTFKLNKVNPGEHFPDLELVNKFLAAKKPPARPINPSIEVLGESSQGDDGDSDSDIDCDFLQQPAPEQDVCAVGAGYGFANQTRNAFNCVSGEFFEVVDLKNPDGTGFEERRSLQAAKETADFCDDHYLADLMAPPSELRAVLDFEPFWSRGAAECALTDAHRDTLRTFGNREYLLSRDEKKSALLSLVDIIYAYCYAVRTNMGDENAESAWSVNKLSATLCWFRRFDSFDETVASCVRRSLCYPLYRRWDLSVAVLSDVRAVFANGCACLLACLLDVHGMFSASEPRYVFNQLYIRDYCIWVQQLHSSNFDTVVKLFDGDRVEKAHLQLDLEELEVAAMTIEEDIEIVQRQLNGDDTDTEETDTDGDSDIESGLQRLRLRTSSSSSEGSSLDSDDDDDE